MAYTPIYTPKNFVDWGPPDLDANNLNDIEAALVSLGNGLQTAAANTDTNTAAITTINGEISDLNNLIDEILPDDSESSNPAVITDAFAGACKSLKLTLEPIQSGSGTPSPQNVRPISGRTQSVMTRTGKNLINPCVGSFTSVASWVSLENVNANTVTDGTQIYLPEGTYTLSYAERTTAWATQIFSADGSTLLNSSQNSVTFTVSADTLGYIRINVGYQQAVSFKIQIEVGSTATTYEAYNGESITRTYGTTIYGGSDDVTGEGVTVTKGLYIPLVTSVGYSSSAGCNYADCHGITIVEDSDTICNMYDQIPYGNTGADGKYKVYPSAITIYDSRFTDVATAQAILNSCQIVYPLYAPVLIPLTPQNLTLLKGDNVITTDANNVEVEYKADIALYITKQLGGNLGNRGAKSTPAEEPADDTKEEEKTDEKIIEPVTKEAKK